MSKKETHFQNAALLRMKGSSLEAIEGITGVSKNSLSKWFKEEGVNSVGKVLSSHPLKMIEKLDRIIEKKIDEIYDGGGEITPEQSDSLAKLNSIRKGLMGSEDYPRQVVMVTDDMVRFAATYFPDRDDREKLASFLKAFYQKVMEEEYVNK